jgi:hypothetical protein
MLDEDSTVFFVVGSLLVFESLLFVSIHFGIIGRADLWLITIVDEVFPFNATLPVAPVADAPTFALLMLGLNDAGNKLEPKVVGIKLLRFSLMLVFD